MARSRKAKREFNVEKWLEEHQKKHPPAAVTDDDLVRRYQRGSRAVFRRNPFRLLRAFVSCFHYNAGRATVATRPDNSMLEILAELFKQWLTGKASLDETFGLVSSGRGRKSVRENARLRMQAFIARSIYGELRASGMLKKQAVGEVAKALKCSESKASSLVFRRRAV